MHTFKFTLITRLMRWLSTWPYSRLLTLSSAIGFILWYCPNRTKSVTLTNIKHCFPDLNHTQQLTLAKASIQHTAHTIIETSLVWLAPCDQSLALINDVYNQSVLDECIQHKVPTIILAPHLGNWELFNLYVSHLYPVTVMYKPTGSVLIDNFITETRKRLGTTLVKANPGGVMALFKSLKQGQLVGILPDQEPELQHGVFVPFFGLQALTTTLIPRLIAKTQANVIIGFAKRREDKQGFDIHFKRLDNLLHEEIRTATSRMNSAIEQFVLQAPEQYQWEYKRFKRRPQGHSRIY